MNRSGGARTRRLSRGPEDLTPHAGEATALLKAMASTPRLLVLCHLARGECSVGELLQEIPLSASALSQHLAVLRREGLVTSRRVAQVIYYRLSPGPTVAIISVLYDTFCPLPKVRNSARKLRGD